MKIDDDDGGDGDGDDDDDGDGHGEADDGAAADDDDDDDDDSPLGSRVQPSILFAVGSRVHVPHLCVKRLVDPVAEP